MVCVSAEESQSVGRTGTAESQALAPGPISDKMRALWVEDGRAVNRLHICTKLAVSTIAESADCGRGWSNSDCMTVKGSRSEIVKDAKKDTRVEELRWSNSLGKHWDLVEVWVVVVLEVGGSGADEADAVAGGRCGWMARADSWILKIESHSAVSIELIVATV